MTDFDRLAYNESEVMTMLQLSRNTVRQLRLSGRLTHIRIGRRVLYPASGIQAFLDSCLDSDGSARETT